MTDDDGPNVDVADLPEPEGVTVYVGGGNTGGLEFLPLLALLWLVILI